MNIVLGKKHQKARNSKRGGTDCLGKSCLRLVPFKSDIVCFKGKLIAKVFFGKKPEPFSQRRFLCCLKTLSCFLIEREGGSLCVLDKKFLHLCLLLQQTYFFCDFVQFLNIFLVVLFQKVSFFEKICRSLLFVWGASTERKISIF